uniref:Uncharacterized protein n=1 Tax=Leersia perrieri TaxID=77586 RepID=A0A0D9XCB4_9ORYZ
MTMMETSQIDTTSLATRERIDGQKGINGGQGVQWQSIDKWMTAAERGNGVWGWREVGGVRSVQTVGKGVVDRRGRERSLDSGGDREQQALGVASAPHELPRAAASSLTGKVK